MDYLGKNAINIIGNDGVFVGVLLMLMDGLLHR